MRDSILILILFLGLSGAFVTWRNQRLNHTQITTPVASTPLVAASQPNRNFVKRNKNQGETKHESSNRKRRNQARHHGKSEGIARQAHETQGLPSLYSASEERARSTVNGSAVVDSAEENSLPLAEAPSDEIHSEDAASTPNVVHGVSVDAWVRAQKNHLPTAEVSPPAPGGVRVFLWCMELKKKGPQYSGNKECNDLMVAQTEHRSSLSRSENLR